MSVYTEHGYENRTDYLTCIADEYDITYKVIKSLADELGKNEDFDGLISAVEDYMEEIEADDLDDEDDNQP